MIRFALIGVIAIFVAVASGLLTMAAWCQFGLLGVVLALPAVFLTGQGAAVCIVRLWP